MSSLQEDLTDPSPTSISPVVTIGQRNMPPRSYLVRDNSWGHPEMKLAYTVDEELLKD